MMETFTSHAQLHFLAVLIAAGRGLRARASQGGTAFVWWATWLKTARGQNVLTIRIFEQARKRIETANEAVE